MHIFLVGGAGRTGRYILEYALEAGHDVTALVREQPLHIEHPSLEVIKGDLITGEEWTSYIFPGTAIISAISAPKDQKDLLIVAAERLVEAGEKGGASRIILLGGAGSLKVGEQQLLRELPDFPTVFKDVSAAHLRASHVVEKSSMGWTVFCPPDIKTGERTKNYRTQETFVLDQTKWISFQDLADAIIRSINRDSYLMRRVAISY